jgi:hypothetical protein
MCLSDRNSKQILRPMRSQTLFIANLPNISGKKYRLLTDTIINPRLQNKFENHLAINGSVEILNLMPITFTTFLFMLDIINLILISFT